MWVPGMLPVLNEECVRQAVRTGLGLNAKINLRSVFDRKNYLSDLAGYQISQYKSPIVGEARSSSSLRAARRRRSALSGCMEQDPAKMLHDKSPSMSLIDSIVPASR